MKENKILANPYIRINIIFAGIVMMIFIYSGIFSAEKSNYPIRSAAENYTSGKAKSVGLSRSFSEIVRFNFNKAKEYNPHGLRVFAFFLTQFSLRFIISLIIAKSWIALKWVVITDASLSVILYLYCFWGIII